MCDNGLPRCPDGSCRSVGECCPGSRRCADGFCLKETTCCDEEKICDDGSCASQDVCCPGNRMCDDGGCVKPGDCCIGEQRCLDGTCIPKDACCYDVPGPTCGVCQLHRCLNGEEKCVDRQGGDYCLMPWGDPGSCCNGECTRTPITCANYPWREFNPNTCGCECKADTVDAFPGQGEITGKPCCPASHPYGSEFGRCTTGDPTQWTCLIGYHACPEIPGRPPSCGRDC